MISKVKNYGIVAYDKIQNEKIYILNQWTDIYRLFKRFKKFDQPSFAPVINFVYP